MKKIYTFREGSPYSKKEAQKVGEFLETYKAFKPKKVIELARPKNSPIHKFFDWNDTTAAEKYRLEQARSLVSALYIKIENTPVKAYENVKISIKEGNSYVPTDDVFSNEDLTAQVIEAAKRELLYWEAKYSLYKDYLPEVFSVIRRLREEQANGKSQKSRGTDYNRSADRGKNRNNNTRGNNSSSRKSVRRKVKNRNAGEANEGGKKGKGSKGPTKRVSRVAV